MGGWIINPTFALAGEAQWIECQPADQKFAGSIPSQGPCLGCGPGPWLGTYERQLMDVSPLLHIGVLSLSISLPSSL